MLQKLKFAPGFNKQVTATGGEGQWVNGDNVRFRYGSPEKIGGWAQLGSVEMTGRNTAIHHFVNTSGIKYAALGTSSILYAYSGGIFYDIHPIKATTTLTSAFSTTNGSAVVTLTFSSAHNIGKGDITSKLVKKKWVKAKIITREKCIVSGTNYIKQLFSLKNCKVKIIAGFVEAILVMVFMKMVYNHPQICLV